VVGFLGPPDVIECGNFPGFQAAGIASVVLFLALIPVADSILKYHSVGSFIGSHMVSAAALLLLAGAWLMPRGVAASSR